MHGLIVDLQRFEFVRTKIICPYKLLQQLFCPENYRINGNHVLSISNILLQLCKNIIIKSLI